MSAVPFYLTLKSITDETADTKTFEFWHPIHQAIAYQAGQFLTLIPNIEGKKHRRSYSFSSSPKTDSGLAVTVKRLPGGLVSNYLCDNLKVGDALEVLEPMGKFTLVPLAERQAHYVLVAAGSGITPLFSILKTILKAEPESKVDLIYGSRHEDQIIFKAALDALEQQYPQRFRCLHVISQAKENWPGFKGRIHQASMVYYLKQELQVNIAQAQYYVCGPEGMLEQVRSALAMFDVPAEHIHYELFYSSPDERPEPAQEEGPKDEVVRLIYEGKEHSVTVKPSQTILEAALEADIDLPYSCQAGMCTACLGTCTQGQVKMDEEDGLTPNEIAKGLVLTCVAHPLTSDVVIQID